MVKLISNMHVWNMKYVFENYTRQAQKIMNCQKWIHTVYTQKKISWRITKILSISALKISAKNVSPTTWSIAQFKTWSNTLAVAANHRNDRTDHYITREILCECRLAHASTPCITCRYARSAKVVRWNTTRRHLSSSGRDTLSLSLSFPPTLDSPLIESPD